jgi:hypothetical protein
MTETTAELNTTQETAAPNGHDETWQTFDDDNALWQHIAAKEAPQEVVEIAEWNVKILCKMLDADGRVRVEGKAYDKKLKNTDYRRALDLLVIYGCYNPTTGKRCFKEDHGSELLKHGGPTAILATTVLRLSGMLAADVEHAKKN